jgi:hypothetical protein
MVVPERPPEVGSVRDVFDTSVAGPMFFPKTVKIDPSAIGPLGRPARAKLAELTTPVGAGAWA